MSTQTKTFLVLLILMLAGSGCASGADQSIVRTKIAVEMQQTALSMQQSQATLAAQQTALGTQQEQAISTAAVPATGGQVDPSLQQTQVALAVQQTALAANQLALTQAQTSTPVPPTRAPASPTPSGPMFTSRENANCRQGDSRHYQYVSQVNTGQSVRILGKSKAHGGFNWWFVQTADGNQCYVSSDLGTTSGDTSTVPDRAAPTLNSWQGVWTVNGDVEGSAIEFRRDGNTFEWSTDWDDCNPRSQDSAGSIFSSDESLSGEVEEYWIDQNGDCNKVDSFGYKIAFAVDSNHNQFVGNIGGEPFCGYRNGAGLPNPCSGP